MGIESFFNTITKNKIISESLLIKEKINCNYLYIDFNSIIYIVADILENEINYYLFSIIINKKDEKCVTIEKKYDIHLNNIDEFKTYFTQERIGNLVNIYIYEYIENLILNIIITEDLKDIFISIDGTPTMSKIVEQKKRRHMNYIISYFKEQIYEKFKHSIDEINNLFYENKISFNRGYITSWSNYIQEIFNNLNSPSYKIKLKEYCINLENIIISSAYEFGEGEKKIMENILFNKKPGSYVIFSPDSDVVLLSLIMQNTLSKNNIENTFNLIRHNQNENVIENISICILRDNIYNFIYNKMNNYRKNNHSKSNIINDIIGIFTFFGNDFLPKIESINTKNGFIVLMDLYAKHLNWCRSYNIYLLFEENNIVRINYDVFCNIINKISENEDKLIFDKFLSHEYKNYNYLSNILEPNEITPFFIDRINRYSHGFNKIIRYIKLNPECTSEIIINNIINNFTDRDCFIKQFCEIEKTFEYENMDNNILIKLILDKYIEKLKNKENIRCGLKFVKYSDSIDDKYHQKCLKDLLLHPEMIITEYDKEVYKLEKRMDNYKNIGLDNSNKMGICELKYKDSEYKIYTDKNIEEKKKFYYEKILNCFSDNSINYVCKEYIKGFCWVIDFYFNKNNRDININNISIWHYKFDHTPYFKELNKYLSNMYNRNLELTKLFFSVSDINNSLYVKSSQFMNRFEQYLYITPKHNHNNVPDIYNLFLDESNLFMDLNDFVKKLLNGENHILDVYNTKFFNKGNIIGLKNYDFTKFMEKMYQLRKLIDVDKLLDL